MTALTKDTDIRATTHVLGHSQLIASGVVHYKNAALAPNEFGYLEPIDNSHESSGGFVGFAVYKEDNSANTTAAGGLVEYFVPGICEAFLTYVATNNGKNLYWVDDCTVAATGNSLNYAGRQLGRGEQSASRVRFTPLLPEKQ